MKKGLLLALGIAAVAAGPGAGAARADFVCPVLNLPSQAVEKSGKFAPLGESGQYTTLPGRAGDEASSPVNPPDHATNADGEGTPGVDHVGPGDPGYSPIWNTP
jgi:hypothetical protein